MTETPQFFLDLLKPGDVLLFSRKGFFDWTIRHATKSPITHTEVYIDGRDAQHSWPKTVASRNGIGVGTYGLDLTGLAVVLRPKAPFDLQAALTYQASVSGQAYAWRGMFRAFVQLQWGHTDTQQWCSEHSTNIERAGGIDPFTPDIPADFVMPGDLLKSASFTHVWKTKDIQWDSLPS